jgi:hypothetical protein
MQAQSSVQECLLLGCDAVWLLVSRATGRHIPEDGILHSHRRENIKPYKKNFVEFSQRANYTD